MDNLPIGKVSLSDRKDMFGITQVPELPPSAKKIPQGESEFNQRVVDVVISALQDSPELLKALTLAIRRLKLERRLD